MNIFNANPKTLPINATGSPSASTALPAIGGSIRVINKGTDFATFHLSTGTAAVTAPVAGVANDFITMSAGNTETFSIPSNVQCYVSVIGSGVVEFSVGEGA